MTGLVLEHHASLEVPFRISENGEFRNIDIEFVIDTGFEGYLTLPPAAVQVLELPFVRSATAKLADGSTIEVAVHEAEIVWQENIRRTNVFAMGDVPLLGTLLLDGCELNIRFADHEDVTVTPL